MILSEFNGRNRPAHGIGEFVSFRFADFRFRRIMEFHFGWSETGGPVDHKFAGISVKNARWLQNKFDAAPGRPELSGIERIGAAAESHENVRDHRDLVRRQRIGHRCLQAAGDTRHGFVTITRPKDHLRGNESCLPGEDKSVILPVEGGIHFLDKSERRQVQGDVGFFVIARTVAVKSPDNIGCL